jgi:hypothetical protein
VKREVGRQSEDTEEVSAFARTDPCVPSNAFPLEIDFHELPPPPTHPHLQKSSSTHDHVAPEEQSSKLLATTLNCSFDQGDAVTLHVGPTEHTILAHANFISRESEFFEAALKKEWAESRTRIIKLPDECPHLVTHYLNYVYCKCLPTDIVTPASKHDFVQNSDQHYQLLAKLYVLGERLLDRSVRGAAINEIIRLANIYDNAWTRHCPGKETVKTIYRGTPARSPARRLMVDCHVALGTGGFFDSTCEAEFVLDVVQSMYHKMIASTTSKDRYSAVLHAPNYRV